MKDYKIVYTWIGDIEVEAESEEDAMDQMHSMMDGSGGDPRGLFNLDHEDYEVEEAR